MVYPVLYLGGLFLRYFCHALTFGQFTAYQLVCDLVRAALMRGLRMAVERSHAEGICFMGYTSQGRHSARGAGQEPRAPRRACRWPYLFIWPDIRRFALLVGLLATSRPSGPTGA